MDVFVYGTLTDPDRAFTVVPEARYLGPAKIVGLHVVEDRYPTLAPGGTATGRILRTDDVAALDEYEGGGNRAERSDIGPRGGRFSGRDLRRKTGPPGRGRRGDVA
ncbi:MAG: gamma-glutamylcyclotransferase (GGCT)/AIG2-like uncharacterized protein YtfP, partial [Halobacteriales archaeon]